MARRLKAHVRLDPTVPANAYRAFDALIRSAERWLAGRRLPDFDAPEKAVRERLAQRVVELAFPPFMRAWPAREDTDDASLDARGLAIDSNTGRVTLAPAQLGRLVLEFGAHWALALAEILRGFAGRKTIGPGPVTLLFGVGNDTPFHRGSDERFVAFCREGPVRPLREATQLVVQTALRSGSVSDARVAYAARPLLAAAREARLGAWGRARLLARHLAAPLGFAALVARRPLTALLAPDLAVDHIARTLAAHGDLEAVVVTNTLYTSQPLWMRRFAAETGALHMVWYSQNTIPFVYARDGVRADLPHNRHIRVSRHWVWTEGYRAYLEKLGIGAAVEVVGPILWYLPSPPYRRERGVQIAVFDVTPVSEAYAETIGLLDRYYSSANMLSFLRGVIALKGALEAGGGPAVRVRLKHKRVYNAAHDRAYVDFVAAHSGPGGPLALVPPDDDMYSLIGASDLTIVAPYSSPALVSAGMGVPAIFFDAPRLLVDSHDGGPLLDFASGEDALIEKAKSALAKPAVAHK